MMNIFRIERVDENCSIHFTVTTPGAQRYKVGVYDSESEMPIHVENDWELVGGLTYFITPGKPALKMNRLFIEIQSHDGDSQREHIVNGQGTTRYPVVLGKPFKFSHDDRVAFYTLQEIFYERIYDRDFVKLENGDVVLDIGANLGVFSVYAQNFYPSKVVAVEPGIVEYSSLLKNINSFSNALAYQYAVTDRNGKVNFSLTSEGVSNHIQGVYGEEPRSLQTVEVNAIHIDDLIKEAGLTKIDYLKVDCEGSELNIFRAINKEYLKNCIRKIAVEYHTKEIRKELIDIITKQGFSLENLDEGKNHDEIGILYFYKTIFSGRT